MFTVILFRNSLNDIKPVVAVYCKLNMKIKVGGDIVWMPTVISLALIQNKKNRGELFSSGDLPLRIKERGVVWGVGFC